MRTAADNVMIQQTSGGGSLFDLGNYNKAGSVEQTTRNSKAQTWSGKADAEMEFPDWSVPTTFKVGLADSLEVRNVFTLQAKWTMTLTSGPTSGTAVNLQDYRDPYTGGVGQVMDMYGNVSRTPGPDKWALYQLFKSYGNMDPFSTVANGPFVAQAANNLRNKLQNDVDINETITSAYAMATVKPIKPLSVVAGLRFENTKSQGRAYDDKGNKNTVALTGTTNTNDFGYIYARYGTRITREKTYTNTLPVLQARYEINKSFIARAAYYASILRPDFQNVIGGISTTDNADGTYAFTLNNNALKPETANNFDVAVEYYFEPVGVVSASMFYKDIKNIQVSQPGVLFPATSADVQQQILAAGYSASDTGLANSKVSSTVNGPKTSIWGFEVAYSQELSFLPMQFKGLGVTANFSHYVPKEQRLWALVPNSGDGIPLNLGNLIIRYKIGSFKTQVAATWTGKRLTGNGLSGMTLNADGSFTPITTATNANVSNYQAARWVISPSAEYQINHYATVFASVNNIFNSAKENYAEREVFTTRNGNYGATINVGVKGSF